MMNTLETLKEKQVTLNEELAKLEEQRNALLNQEVEGLALDFITFIYEDMKEKREAYDERQGSLKIKADIQARIDAVKEDLEPHLLEGIAKSGHNDRNIAYTFLVEEREVDITNEVWSDLYNNRRSIDLYYQVKNYVGEENLAVAGKITDCVRDRDFQNSLPEEIREYLHISNYGGIEYKQRYLITVNKYLLNYELSDDHSAVDHQVRLEYIVEGESKPGKFTYNDYSIVGSGRKVGAKKFIEYFHTYMVKKLKTIQKITLQERTNTFLQSWSFLTVTDEAFEEPQFSEQYVSTKFTNNRNHRYTVTNPAYTIYRLKESGGDRVKVTFPQDITSEKDLLEKGFDVRMDLRVHSKEELEKIMEFAKSLR